MAAQTIPALFDEQAKRFGDRPLLWTKRSGAYQPISWVQAQEDVRALAASFLEAGVAVGDRIVVLCENRPEWAIADLAIQFVGAWTVPIYPSLTEPEILPILRNCEPVIAIASTPEQLRKLRAIRSQIPSLRRVLCAEPAEVAAGESSWTDALAQGRAALGRLGEPLAARVRALQADDIATLIYTSGTTGEPKGVMLSHRNFLANASAGLKAIPISSQDLHLSFLPLCHVFERMAGWYLMLMAGASVAYAESMDTIPQNMGEIRPTIMLGVPRFFEKLFRRVQSGVETAPPAKRRLAAWAFGVNRLANRLRRTGQRISPLLRLQHAVADALVLHKLRARLGGRLRFFVSGSAPLSRSIAEFFDDAGVLILEGYGLTETSPVITVNRPDAVKFGTVGQPIEGVEVRIAPDGEILTRSACVMRGYYRKPEETAAMIVDGWLHTGDIGALDADGFLSITDRKKDLIKTAGGKFVAPQKLENLFVTDPYIAQAFVFGDRERYCVALIRPNLERLVDHARQHHIPYASEEALLRAPATHALIWDRIKALQRDLPSFEQVKAVALLDHDLSQAAGELTPTMKAKRALIASRYDALLRRLYDLPPPAR
jgi:long-chain acyl-CoA synthetase